MFEKPQLTRKPAPRGSPKGNSNASKARKRKIDAEDDRMDDAPRTRKKSQPANNENQTASAYKYQTLADRKNSPLRLQSGRIRLLYTIPRQREVDRLSSQELEQHFQKRGVRIWRHELFRQFGVKNVHSTDARAMKPSVGALRDRVLELRKEVFGNTAPRSKDDQDEYENSEKFEQPLKDPEEEADNVASGEQKESKKKVAHPQPSSSSTAPKEVVRIDDDSDGSSEDARVNAARKEELEQGLANHKVHQTLFSNWATTYDNETIVPNWYEERAPTMQDVGDFISKRGRCFGLAKKDANTKAAQIKLKHWGRCGWQRKGNIGLRHAMDLREMKPIRKSGKHELIDLEEELATRPDDFDDEAFHATMALIRYELEAAQQRFGDLTWYYVKDMVEEVVEEEPRGVNHPHRQRPDQPQKMAPSSSSHLNEQEEMRGTVIEDEQESEEE